MPYWAQNGSCLPWEESQYTTGAPLSGSGGGGGCPPGRSISLATMCDAVGPIVLYTYGCMYNRVFHCSSWYTELWSVEIKRMQNVYCLVLFACVCACACVDGWMDGWMDVACEILLLLPVISMSHIEVLPNTIRSCLLVSALRFCVY